MKVFLGFRDSFVMILTYNSDVICCQDRNCQKKTREIQNVGYLNERPRQGPVA